MAKLSRNFERFDVWSVNLDPTEGAEMKKTRPCVIVSPNAMNNNLSTVIIAPVTNTYKDLPFRVYADDSLIISGHVALDQLRAVDKLRLKRKIGVIEESISNDIIKVLRTIFHS
jgi:mRNA interferase MazF